MPIGLPPLRRRRDDIPLLVQHFVDKVRGESGRPVDGVSPEAMALLLDYSWPGNVRELENFIEYAFVKARTGTIEPAHLPPEVQAPAVRNHSPVAGDSEPRRQRVRSDLTRDRVGEVLSSCGWNIATAARRLEVSRTTLYQRIAEYGLEEPR
jgi:DNA-binding NtrC family response regulator